MKNTIINGKYELILPDHRAIRPDWDIKNGGWEFERLESMHKSIKKGDVVFDIGTEEGDMSGLLSLWSGGNLVMFEPNPKVWPNIKAIWDANHLKMPLGWFVGFASSKTELSPKNLNIDQSEKDGWPICAYGDLIGDHGFRHLSQEADATPQITIDDFCSLRNVYPDVISMDIEGSEFEALKGADKVLSSRNLKVFVSVHPEIMFDHHGSYTRELVDYMKDHGYKHELLAFDHEFHMFFGKGK